MARLPRTRGAPLKPRILQGVVVRNAAAFIVALFTALPSWADVPFKVVPRPRAITPLPGRYRLPSRVTIHAELPRDDGTARFLASYLRGVGVNATVTGQRADTTIAVSSRGGERRVGREGYTLLVTGAGIRITANTPQGAFYGMQTLEQLLPVGVRGPVSLPNVRIVDWPHYRWRGIHLDVARHFFSPDVVKQYIDLAARFKLNVFHWHLTDDEAWRLAVPRYPALTPAGDCAGSAAACGYYSQRDVADIVAYARRRYVDVLAEMDMPAHSGALLSAYSELGCADGSGVCPSVATFTFVDRVFAEIAQLFPAPYVHIGGDEVTGDANALASAFLTRVQAIAARHGRRVVGWDDILAARPRGDAAIMAWHDEEAGVRAAVLGYDTIMAPRGALYFDAYQGAPTYEPRAFGGVTTLRDVYRFDPTPKGLSRTAVGHIVGAQGNLWTTFVHTPDALFYMLLPRELALAEVAWTPPERRNWDDFLRRLGSQLRRLDVDGYRYRVPTVVFDAAGEIGIGAEGAPNNVASIRVQSARVDVALRDAATAASIKYSLDGSAPTWRSPTYTTPLRIDLSQRGATLGARAVLRSGRMSAPTFLRVSRELR